MELQEEKKLVAEKLMGDKLTFYEGEFLLPTGLPLNKWNPQSERKWWDEIWEKMDDELKDKYMSNLDNIVKGNHIGPTTWDTHIAKPEICWKALIKTLEQI